MSDLITLTLSLVLSRGYVCEQPPGWEQRVIAEVLEHDIEPIPFALVVREARCKPTRSLRP